MRQAEDPIVEEITKGHYFDHYFKYTKKMGIETLKKKPKVYWKDQLYKKVDQIPGKMKPLNAKFLHGWPIQIKYTWPAKTLKIKKKFYQHRKEIAEEGMTCQECDQHVFNNLEH